MSQRKSSQPAGKSIPLARESTVPENPAGHFTAAFLLLCLGILIWGAIGGGRGIGELRWAIMIGAAALGLLPPVAGVVLRAVQRIRHPSRRTAALAALLIALLAAGYFILTAILQDRDLFPKTHDDCSYLIQMQMLARGRLWMAALPLPDFFDSFYIIVRPVYASQYFPGTALLYVPTIWLHLPTWVMPVLAAGAVVGLTYWILTELVDGTVGALGALWIASLNWFRMASVLLMSQIPALLFGLLMVWGWLRWRRDRRNGWMLLIGVTAGWAAVTRPVDAICFAVAVGIAVAADLGRARLREWVAVGALLALGAAPFLAIQFTLDKGVTGHFFQTPFRMYLDRDVPGTQFGFPAQNPTARPQSVVQEKQDYYFNWVKPFIEHHQPSRLIQSWAGRWFPMIVDTTTPARVMLPLATAGLIASTDRRRWVLLGTVPLFVLLYGLYAIFLEHYAIVLIPAVAMLSLIGIEVIGGAVPRIRTSIIGALTLLVVTACVTSFWEINRLIAPPGKQIDDETIHSPMLRQINLDIPSASDLKKPAVFLFRYHPGDNFFEEPVYNTDVAWPDDAQIIRAHDLGPKRDREIVAYYAARTPVREFYLFDSKSPTPINDLGPTSDPPQILEHVDRTEAAVTK